MLRFVPSQPARWPLFPLSIALLLIADSAAADCQVDPDGTGNPNLVVCRDLDADGFDGSATDSLEVQVEDGARVENGGVDGVASIAVGDGGTINTNGSSEIDASGAGAAGIEGGSATTTTHLGTLTADGDGARGIVGGQASDTTVGVGSTVSVTGADSIAVLGDDSGASGIRTTIRQNGAVSAAGLGAVGVRVGEEGIVTAAQTALPTIDVSGGSNIGIDIGDSAIAASLSDITVAGDDGIGIRAAENGTIFNAGDITITGTNGTGLAAGDAGAVISQNQIANDNAITIIGDGAVGISAGENRLTTNPGSIELVGDDAIGIRLGPGSRLIQAGSITIDGDDAVGVILEDGGTVGSVENIQLQTGSKVTITGADGVGLQVGSGRSALTAGKIKVTGANGIGIDLGAGSTLTNRGSVIGGSGTGVAVQLLDAGTVTNEAGGVIDGSASGRAILGSAGIDIVINQGSIRGDVQLGDGDDVFGLTGGSSLDGALRGGAGVDAFQLMGSGNGSFDLGGPSGFESLEILDGGRWRVSGTGSWVNGVTVTNGTFAPRGRVELTGDYTQAAGTAFELHVDADGTTDRLDVTGAATIEDTARLTFDQSGGVVAPGRYTVLTATGGLTGRFDDSGFEQDLGEFLTFLADYDANSLTLKLIRQSYTTAARTPNQFRTATNLDAIAMSGPTGDMATVIRTLDGLDLNATSGAEQQLNPEIYDSFSHASLLHGRAFADALRHHQPLCRQYAYDYFNEKRKTKPACGSYGVSPWASVLGQLSDRNGSGGHSDYDIAGGGLAAGVDWRGDKHLTASAGMAFLGSDVDFQGQGDGSLLSLELGIEAAYERPWLRVDGAFLYGHGWNDADRDIDFLNRTASGDYDTDHVGLVADLGVPIPVGPVIIEPGFGIDYTYLIEESFDESGASSVNLDIDERTKSIFSTAAGLTLRTEWFNHVYWAEWLEWADGVWRPEVFAQFRTVWVGADRKLEASFQGAPDGVGSYRVKADDDDNGAEFGARVSFQPIDSKITAGFAYTGFVGKDTTSHRGTFEVRVPLP